MTRYRRAVVAGGTYFFTVVTYRRRRFLTDAEPRQWLREAIHATRADHPFKIDAWVLLPDHLHCIWTLPKGDADFSTRWALLKSRFTKRAGDRLSREGWMSDSKRKHREGTLWQRRFWEHAIRDDRDFEAHLHDIHFNPVKHGLVRHVADWPFSTFHRYVKAGTYPSHWAGMQENPDSDLGKE
ncbi:REP-associated tyrosine transposase [Thiocystis violacea]|uniref:REP-associated tyrosine transposase n=1 Tax=Thiocystis violacea TaxID=13725 RepID=UPI001902CBCC|nr:transposase [Thiocystis violacea]MBK1723022.1 transposase [Thiocystis violacea]